MAPINYYYCEKCDAYSKGQERCGHERVLLFSGKQKVKLSKFLSFVFRHDPRSLNLELDAEGFALLPPDELISRLNQKEGFEWVDRQKLEALVQIDHKGRFEIRNNQFRARYGHSLKAIDLQSTDQAIPSILYHGTNMNAYKLIRLEGIKPMDRNLVHLTTSLTDAQIVAKRHGGEMVLLEIDAKNALIHGIKISQASPTIYVTKFVPYRYIKRIE